MPSYTPAMASSTTKKIGIALLVLVLVAAIVVGWMWHRITALPDWYAQGDMIGEDGKLRVDSDWVQIPDAAPPADAPPGAKVYVLRNPHVRAELDGTPIKQAIKQSRAAYAGGQLEAGAVLNLSEAELDSLSAEERERFQETVDAFPALTGRDVYVGVEGDVSKRDGKMVLGPDAQLRVGDTTYSIASAAKRLGMSEADLRAAIEKELATLATELPEG
jgi:hypothetical protein